MKRRSFVQSGLLLGSLVAATGAGILTPARVWARNWPDRAFRSNKETEARKSLFGDLEPITSDAVKLNVPKQGNRQGVGVSVETNLEGVEAIALMVATNPQPLCGVVTLSRGAQGFFKTRVRLRESSTVSAYVKAGEKLYVASATVKLSTSGYGVGHQ